MKKKGFTLVELLAVIIIIAIIAAIAVPIIIKRINRAETDSYVISLKEAVKEYESGVLEGVYEDRMFLKDLDMINNKFLTGTISYNRETGEIKVEGVGDGENFEESSFAITSATKEEIFADEYEIITNPKLLLFSKLKNSVGTDEISLAGYYDEEDGYIKGGNYDGENATSNYIKIPEKDDSEALYRAVRIHSDGRVLVVRNSLFGGSQRYDSTLSTNNFADTSIKNYLNDIFFTEQIIKNKYIVDTIWDTRCANYDEDIELEYGDCPGGGPQTTVAKVGLLTLNDVLKVGVEFYNISITYLKCDGWWWLGTGDYSHVKSVWGIIKYTGAVGVQWIGSEFGVRPAFTLKANITVTGTGTLTDPYEIIEN